jgi:hypothetical protein
VSRRQSEGVTVARVEVSTDEHRCDIDFSVERATLRAPGWMRLLRTMNGGTIAIDLGVDREASRKGQCPTKS